MKIKVHPTVTHARRALRGESKVIRLQGDSIVMYDKPTLPESKTPEQLAVRDAWRAAVDAWRPLSTATKAAWSDLARTVDAALLRQSSEPLNGYRLFLSCAKVRQILGQPVLTEPQGFSAPVSPTAVELLPAADEHTLRFRIRHEVRGAGAYRIVVSMTPPTVAPSRKPDRRNGRHIKGYGPQSTAILPEDGGVVEFTGTRYAAGSGQRLGVWVRVVHPETAIAGPEFFADVVRPGAGEE